MESARLDEFAETIRGYEVNSDLTIDKYQRWITRFEAWRPGGDPDEEMLRDFDAMLADPERPQYPWTNRRGPSPPDEYAYRSRVQALSAAKLWAKHEYDARIEEVVQNMTKGEPAEFDPTVLEPTEVDHVINQAPLCDIDGCKAAIPVGYDAILRGAELAAIEQDDFDMETGELYVRSVKGDENTTIQLGSRAANALRSHIQRHPDRNRLFYNSYDRPWTPDAWNQHFRRKHHEAGFHAFGRHSAITNRLKQGEDFGDVYLRSRHVTPSTTLKYVSLVGADAPAWVDGR